MNEHQILKNRALNSIENIKFKLKKQKEISVFNDLIILKQIVPSLGKEALRPLLRELKTIDKQLVDGSDFEPSMIQIFRILSD